MFETSTTEELLLEDIIGLTALINRGEFDFSNIDEYTDEVFKLIAAAYRAGKAAANN